MRIFAFILTFLIWIGGFIVHLFTTYIAYLNTSFIGLIMTFCMPPFSEMYWFWKIWQDVGFINGYSILIFGYLGLWLLHFVAILIAAKVGTSSPSG